MTEIPGWTHEEERFLDRLDRVTWRVGRALMLGIPVWIVLLLAVPAAIPPIGPMPALVLATAGACAACWALERWVRRNRRPPSAEPAGGHEPEARRRPGGTRLLVAGAVALFLAYGLIVVLVGGGR